jgi:SnoaL-like domain
MESTTTRSTREIFQHHGEALGAEDLEGIVSDYSEDALFITPEGVRRGKDGVREGFRKLLGDLPGASWELPTQVYEDDILLLEWQADSEAARVEDGIDTLRVPRRADPGPDRPLHVIPKG